MIFRPKISESHTHAIQFMVAPVVKSPRKDTKLAKKIRSIFGKKSTCSLQIFVNKVVKNWASI